MPWKYYNPHPQGKGNKDCVKRAVCKAMNMDYMAAQRMLNRIKREFNAENEGIRHANTYRSKYVGYELAKREGWDKITYDANEEYTYPHMYGELFCVTHPKGIYILQMPKHWVACVDGILYDKFDCLYKPVAWAWVVKGE